MNDLKDKIIKCPVEVTLSLITNKWKILIIRELLGGTKRFGELKTSINGISQKVLTANLRQMQEDGLLTREAYPEIPPKVEYTLTATGLSLESVLSCLASWGNEYNNSRNA